MKGPNCQSSVMPVQRAVCDAGSQEAFSPNSDFPQLQTKITRFEGVVRFLLITFYCHKYLEERSTNPGTRAKPPFLSYARSKSGP